MRPVWLAVALTIISLVCAGAWSLVGPGSNDSATTVAGGVVDADSRIITLAATSRDARVSVGDGFAGSWVDETGRLQVAGTSAEALAGVASDGVSVRVAEFSAVDLGAAVHALNVDAVSSGPRLGGASTGWSVNVMQNRVDIETADQQVVADALQALGVDERVVRFVPPVERQPLQRDGSEIYDEFADLFGWAGWSASPSPDLGCSMGVPVVGGFISAGHCAMENGRAIGFVGTPGTVGRVERSLHADNIDAVFVRLDGQQTVDPVVPAAGGFGATPILGVAEAPVGAEVCKVGLKTGRSCGRVLSRNHTSTSGFPFYGLIETNLCADQGDSGGILMWGNQVQGVLSSGSTSGECHSTYTPINYLLDTFNVDLATRNGPVPHLADYERIATTFEQAGGLVLPGAGGTPTTPPPLVIAPSEVPVLPAQAPAAGGGAGEIVVLPGVDTPGAGPADIPVLPAADPPGAGAGAGDIPVLPAADTQAGNAGGDIPVLPGVLPGEGDVPVLPGVPQAGRPLTPTTAPASPAEAVESSTTVPALPAPVPVLPAPTTVPALPAPTPVPVLPAPSTTVPVLPAPPPELPAPVPVLPGVDAQPLQVNLLTNGGFESAWLPTDTLSHVQQAGWASTRPGNVIETWEANYLRVGAPEGRHLIELNGDTADTISQTIAVVPGAHYRWTLDHRGRFDADTVAVAINGRGRHVLTTQPGIWATYSGGFIAQAGETTLTITLTAQDPGSVGNLIDNVRLVRVG